MEGMKVITVEKHSPAYKGGRILREALGRNSDQRWFSLSDVVRNVWSCQDNQRVAKEVNEAVEHMIAQGCEDDIDWENIPDPKSPNRFRRTRIITLGGLIQLSLDAKTPEGKRFSRWVTHDVIVSVFTKGNYTAPIDIPTGAAVNPLETIGAIRGLCDVAENHNKRIDQADEKGDRGIELGTQAIQKIDKIINADDVSSCRKYLEINKIEYESILDQYEIMELESRHSCKNGKMLSKNDYMTAAASKVGKACSAMVKAIDKRDGSNIYDDACARSFDVGNFVGVKQWPTWIIQTCVRDMLGG